MSNVHLHLFKNVVILKGSLGYFWCLTMCVNTEPTFCILSFIHLKVAAVRHFGFVNKKI